MNKMDNYNEKNIDDIITVIRDNNAYGRKSELYCQWYECPKCQGDNITSFFAYCPDCGIKLVFDISEDDE